MAYTVLLESQLSPTQPPADDQSLSSYSIEGFDEYTRSWQRGWTDMLVARPIDAALQKCYHSYELQGQESEAFGDQNLYTNDLAGDNLLGADFYSQWDPFVSGDTTTPLSAHTTQISGCGDLDGFALQQECTYIDSQFSNTVPSFKLGGGIPMTTSSSLSSSPSCNGSVRSSGDDTMWACPYNCGKTFRRPCERRMHEKAHTKPYTCGECHKRFSNRRDMQRHERTHHSQQRYRCIASDCDALFNRKDSWMRHLATTHFDEKASVPLG